MAYKSFFWSIGTTSYRTKLFNRNIERQLDLLDRFRSLPEYVNEQWERNPELQTAYYCFLKKKGFLKGDAPRPDKDAREKTSGLRDIGLLDDSRNLTEAGKALLDLSRSQNFVPDNIFDIPSDSYLYLRQLLKTSVTVGDDTVKPFIILLYILSVFGKISRECFTYLVPLCVNRDTTEFVIDEIGKINRHEKTIDDVIVEVVLGKENYKIALDWFLNHTKTEQLFCDISFNRKSASYGKMYFSIYRALYTVYRKHTPAAAYELFRSLGGLTNGKIRSSWKNLLFDIRTDCAIRKDPAGSLRSNQFKTCIDDAAFDRLFFVCLHLFKTRATLSDYYDLNRRYLSASDIVLFEDETIRLDCIPSVFFEMAKDGLLSLAFTPDPDIGKNKLLENIAPCLNIPASVVYAAVREKYNLQTSAPESIRDFLRKERERRFELLIRQKFPVQVLVELLDLFEKRRDSEIYRLVTENADIPTIFEYVLGLVWFYISGKNGHILEYMNLSFDAGFLPKTHAAGGTADIVWQYKSCSSYPSHTLLLEATLSDGTNQRRMEMEPVSRHLGTYLLNHREQKTYCVFISTYLDLNVVSDFRSRRSCPFYDINSGEHVDGLEIIPLRTSELKILLKKKISYDELYRIFDSAYRKNIPPDRWYKDCLAAPIEQNISGAP